MPSSAPRRKRRRSASPSLPRLLIVIGAVTLIGAGFFIGFKAAQPPPPPDFASLREKVEEPAAASSKATPPAAAQTGTDADEGKSPEPAQPATPAAAESAPLVLSRQPPPGRQGEQPRIAIVVDDLGRSLSHVEALGRLGIPLTYAVLPFETRTPEVVSELRRRGSEIFLHLPMEAKGKANPGPGALTVTMSDDELRRLTAEALEAVPGAVGVNNHMGSAVAADRRSMSAVLREIDERGLAFIDSRTAADTLGYSLARQLGIPAAERQVFLDTYKDRDFIRKQFQVLLQQARKRGGAIAIAHPYAETLEILAAEVPKARELGFDFVPASQLLDG